MAIPTDIKTGTSLVKQLAEPASVLVCWLLVQYITKQLLYLTAFGICPILLGFLVYFKPAILILNVVVAYIVILCSINQILKVVEKSRSLFLWPGKYMLCEQTFLLAGVQESGESTG